MIRIDDIWAIMNILDISRGYSGASRVSVRIHRRVRNLLIYFQTSLMAMRGVASTILRGMPYIMTRTRGEYIGYTVYKLSGWL